MIQFHIWLTESTYHQDPDSNGGYNAPADLYQIAGYIGPMQIGMDTLVVDFHQFSIADLDDPRWYK